MPRKAAAARAQKSRPRMEKGGNSNKKQNVQRGETKRKSHRRSLCPCPSPSVTRMHATRHGQSYSLQAERHWCFSTVMCAAASCSDGNPGTAGCKKASVVSAKSRERPRSTSVMTLFTCLTQCSLRVYAHTTRMNREKKTKTQRRRRCAQEDWEVPDRRERGSHDGAKCFNSPDCRHKKPRTQRKEGRNENKASNKKTEEEEGWSDVGGEGQ